MGGKPRAPLRREAGCRRRWALSLHLAVRGSLYTRGRKNSTGSYNAAGPYTQGGQGVGRRGLSSFCLHIRCGCFASPPPRVALHHHVPAIAAVSLARTVPPLHGMLKKKKKKWVAKVTAAFPHWTSSHAWSNKARTKVIPKQSDTATARCSFNNWHNALPAALLRLTAVRLPARADSCCGGDKYKLLTSATTVVCRSSSIWNSHSPRVNT